MKAELLPLKGKYYGTKVKVTNDNGSEYFLTFWSGECREPSDRELKGQCTIEQWRDNEELPIEDGWGNPTTRACDLVACDSCHFESRETYATAKELVDLVNKQRK